MLKLSLATCLTLGALGAAQAADMKISIDPPTDAGCRAAHAILVDRQRHVIPGTFQFVDGDNMVCFRPPQRTRLVLKPDPAAPPVATKPAPLPRPHVAARPPAHDPAPAAPAMPRVSGDGIPFRGAALAFETGHTIPLTDTRKLGTRIGGNLSQDRVSFNSIEIRMAQRF